MKKLIAFVGALALVAMYAPQVFALGSFEGEEEPTVIYTPSSNSFKSDSYDNMTGSGTYSFVLRFSKSWWDGDRNTSNNDRQRAEVKGLGAHQKPGETFVYSSAWKSNRGGSGSFWHVFQLKATDGDNGAPLVVNSIQSGTSAAVRYCSGTQSGFTVARSYSFSTGSFKTTAIKIKTATSGGLAQASINGDSYSGKTNVGMYRPSATDYRPKWGSYRGVSTSSPYGTDTIQQQSVSAKKQ